MLRHLDGCVLHPIDGKKVIPQILQLKLTPEMLQQLLHSNGTDTSISFDKDMEIRIGDHRHSFSMTPESSKIDVYRRRKQSRSDTFEQVGCVRQRIVVRRQLGNNISEKLKSRQAEEAAAKHERSVQTMDFDPKLKRSKNGALSRASTPLPVRPDSPSRKSPFLQARKSPLLVASSPKIQGVSLRTRVVQSLALGPVTEQELALRLKVPSDAVKSVLADVGQMSGNTWVLRDEHYQGLKVWDWKGYTSAERSNAISRASEAYDRLGLLVTDPSRMRLIHPDKRKPEERQDTSPLSLNPPVSSTTPNAVENTIKTQPEGSHSITTERKSSARGILSTGKVPIEKKRKSDSVTNISPPKPSKLRNTINSESKLHDTTSTDLGSRRNLNVPKSDIPLSAPVPTLTSASTPTQTTREPQVRLPKEHSSQKKLQASTDETSRRKEELVVKKAPVLLQPSSKRPSVSPSKTSESMKRSQTAHAEPAKLAPSSRSPVLMDDSFDDRTASITSASTVNTDRTADSTNTNSTAPTSVSSPPPTVKPRSKFLTSKKDSKKSLGVTNAVVPTTRGSIANQSAKVEHVQTSQSDRLPTQTPAARQKQAESEGASRRKRKAEAEDETRSSQEEGQPRKRLQSIDLQNMARDYKRLYPEYRNLHQEVATKIGDPSLLTKFMEMHNQMSLWKQTLFAAEKDYN